LGLTTYRYIFNEEATKNAFTVDGFYKTGDVGRREGDYYYVMGRASVDRKQVSFL